MCSEICGRLSLDPSDEPFVNNACGEKQRSLVSAWVGRGRRVAAATALAAGFGGLAVVSMAMPASAASADGNDRCADEGDGDGWGVDPETNDGCLRPGFEVLEMCRDADGDGLGFNPALNEVCVVAAPVIDPVQEPVAIPPQSTLDRATSGESSSSDSFDNYRVMRGEQDTDDADPADPYDSEALTAYLQAEFDAGFAEAVAPTAMDLPEPIPEKEVAILADPEVATPDNGPTGTKGGTSVEGPTAALDEVAEIEVEVDVTEDVEDEQQGSPGTPIVGRTERVVRAESDYFDATSDVVRFTDKAIVATRNYNVTMAAFWDGLADDAIRRAQDSLVELWAAQRGFVEDETGVHIDPNEATQDEQQAAEVERSIAVETADEAADAAVQEEKASQPSELAETVKPEDWADFLGTLFGGWLSGENDEEPDPGRTPVVPSGRDALPAGKESPGSGTSDFEKAQPSAEEIEDARDFHRNLEASHGVEAAKEESERKTPQRNSGGSGTTDANSERDQRSNSSGSDVSESKPGERRY